MKYKLELTEDELAALIGRLVYKDAPAEMDSELLEVER
jgi:hypothetical protein